MANSELSSDSNDIVDILVVDDRSADRLVLSDILSGTRRNVVVASSGPEALKRLLEREYAVILLDVLMPTMDGFELASLIKQREKTRYTPIIFLTAAGSDVGKLYRAYSLGAVDYLYKPIDADIVQAKVSIFVDLFRKDLRIRRQAEALREAERRESDLQIAELRLAVERRYVNLAEAIPQMVWTSDANGEMTYVNRRWVEYTGLDLERARGSGWLAALHEQDAPECRQAWNEALANRRIYEAQFRLKRARDGAFRWHLCRAVPELDHAGQVVAWLGTYTDFEELKQAVQARDEFLSIASHELRTPLTALKLRLEALLYSGNLDLKLRQKLESAARQTQRLERLIDNLLDVSRITTGHLDLDWEGLELAEITSDVVERIRPEANASGSPIEIVKSSPVHGFWDRLRLEQVITNLLSNAIKYGNRKPIVVRIAENQGLAHLEVEDGGIGIAPADVSLIFDRFERGANRRNHGGLGMGLYITRQIIAAHGGSIRVKSQLGQGTVFDVYLPMEPAASALGTRKVANRRG